MEILRQSVDIGGHEGVEAELFDRNDKLRQFSLVCLDHVCMRASDLLQLVLELRDDVALSVLYLLDRSADSPDSPAVDVGGLEHLVQLEVLDLELLADCCDFLLEDEVVEALALLDGVDGVIEHFEQFLSLFLLVFVALHLHLVLVLQVPELSLLGVDLPLYRGLLLYYLLLLEQVLPVSANL